MADGTSTLWVVVDSSPSGNAGTRPQGTCWVEVIKYGKSDKPAPISVVIMHLKKKIYLVSEENVIEFLPSSPSLAAPSWLPQQSDISKVANFTVPGLVADSVPSIRNNESQLTQRGFQSLIEECTAFVAATLKYKDVVETFKIIGSVVYHNDAIVKTGCMVKKSPRSRTEAFHNVYEIESLVSSSIVLISRIFEGYFLSFDKRFDTKKGYRYYPAGIKFPDAYIYANLDKEWK